MRYLFAIPLFLFVFGTHAHAQDSAAPASEESVWSPSQVDWQVVRAKDKNAGKDICVIRWIYDKSASLSFLKKNNQYSFVMSFNNLSAAPLLNKDSKYYGVISKKDDSIAQATLSVLSDKVIEIKDDKAVNIAAYHPVDKISLFFTDRIYNLPLTNALENFEAYEKCQNTLDLPSQEVEKALPPPPSKEPVAQDLGERANQHLADIKNNSMIPPTLPAFRMSNTKAEIMEKYRKIEQDSGSDMGGANQNLLHKLQVLELEKEELRKKLLTLTQESYIPGLVACEPGAGQDNEAMLAESIKESYSQTIEQLRNENRELREKLDSCPDCF